MPRECPCFPDPDRHLVFIECRGLEKGGCVSTERESSYSGKQQFQKLVLPSHGSRCTPAQL